MRSRQPNTLGLHAVSSALEEGRYELACVRALQAGQPIPERRAPCFFNPQHGPSVQDVTWTPPGGAPREVPACADCASRVARGVDVDAKTVSVGGQATPYWNAGPDYAGYAGGYYGGFGGMLPGLLVGTLLGSSFGGGFGYGGFGGGYGGGFGGTAPVAGRLGTEAAATPAGPSVAATSGAAVVATSAAVAATPAAAPSRPRPPGGPAGPAAAVAPGRHTDGEPLAQLADRRGRGGDR